LPEEALRRTYRLHIGNDHVLKWFILVLVNKIVSLRGRTYSPADTKAIVQESLDYMDREVPRGSGDEDSSLVLKSWHDRMVVCSNRQIWFRMRAICYEERSWCALVEQAGLKCKLQDL